MSATLLGLSVNLATGGTAPRLSFVSQHLWWWVGGATAATALSTLLLLMLQRWQDHQLLDLVPADQQPETWVVDRPAQVDQVVRALRSRGGPTIGISTALHGAGGFGKTTVARIVRANKRVLRRFDGRIYWVTLGRDARGAALAEKVNDLVKQIDPSRAQPFTDIRQAADHLAAVLAAGPRRLVIVDDVWFEDQLVAFPIAGKARRLVTTRNRSLVAERGIHVAVDQMSAEQAKRVLSHGLPPLPRPAVAGLLQEAGAWPLLLRLINRILADQARSTVDIAGAADDLLSQLRRDKLQVDHLTGAAMRDLDVNDPSQRDDAVAATIEASIGLLTQVEKERFAELAVFVEDEVVPVPLVALLWRATSNLTEVASRALCARLADLALISLTPTSTGGSISIHDVIRDYLIHYLGEDRTAALHHDLVESAAGIVPKGEPKPPGNDSVSAWWELPADSRYLRDHLVSHLLASRRVQEAEDIATDLRWMISRLEFGGPVAPYIDLVRVKSQRATRQARLMAQIAHLLGPTNPAYSQADILLDRFARDPELGIQAQRLLNERTTPCLPHTWPPPDDPDPALLRTLSSDTQQAHVVISPDGSWLATAGEEGHVQFWDVATGELLRSLTFPLDGVSAIAVSPDGAWLASISGDAKVRIWDTLTCELVRTVENAKRAIAVAFDPNGAWLATVNHQGLVQLWDVASAKLQRSFAGPTKDVGALAISPDGAWLAISGGRGERVSTWDTTKCVHLRTFDGPAGRVTGLCIAPDSSWLATICDGRVKTWDVASGKARSVVGADGVVAIAISSDGMWLATTSRDTTARLWDPRTGRLHRTFDGHAAGVGAVAFSPDGSWLATTSSDRTTRIWDVSTKPSNGRTADAVRAMAVAPSGGWLATVGREGNLRLFDTNSGERLPIGERVDNDENVYADEDKRTRIRPPILGSRGVSVSATAVSPDAKLLATGCADGSIQIWGTADYICRRSILGHAGAINAVGISPDGSWFASAGRDHTIRIWSAADGRLLMTLNGDASVEAISVAPDGTWFASTDSNGQMRVRATDTGEQLWMFESEFRLVPAIATSPDGTCLAGGDNDGTLWVWNPRNGTLRQTLKGHRAPITGVAFSPDGNWLATTSTDLTVRVWNLAHGTTSAMNRLLSAGSHCLWDPSGNGQLFVAGNRGLHKMQHRP